MQAAMETRQNLNTQTAASAFKLADRSDVAPGLFTLTFDMPGEKVNKLSDATLPELDVILKSLKSRSDIKAMLFISGKDNIFIAGADINIIQSIKTKADGIKMAASGQAILEQLENLPFPVIAAIHGASMGGGTELSLCCKYIITSDAPITKIGLPEVNLGVLPGFGGTVRMPERIGLTNAMDYILTGKTMDGQKAVKLGFAEACFPWQEFQKHALAFAAKVAKGDKPQKQVKTSAIQSATHALLEENPLGRMIVFNKARQMIMDKTRGKYPATLKIIETLSKNYGKSRRKALDIESDAFGELVITDESKRLIELFFATEKVKKNTGVPGQKLDPKDKINSIGLLGAGIMGGGIAQVSAHKGIPIRMKDINLQGLALGTGAARKIFDDLVKKKRMTPREAEIKFALISPTTDYTGFNRVDVTIEAVVENMDVKKKVLKETEAAVREGSIIATNTSSLSVTEMGSVLKDQGNFVGMHFFNPVNKMPLVEVIRGDKTSDRATMAIFDLSKRMGKTPIVVKDGPGFLVNRLLMPYLNEAAWILSEGADILELDEAVLDFGMPMGPCTLLDEIGIDTGAKVAHILHKGFGVRAEPCKTMDKLVEQKLYGKKTGKGFYLYDAKGKKGELNPGIYESLGTQKKSFSKEQKQDWIYRQMYMMVNEAAICLADGIVIDPMDVDLGMIMGTGFPPFRGGLLRYAEAEGLKKIVDTLARFEKTLGPRFKPSQELVNRANSGKKFYS